MKAIVGEEYHVDSRVINGVPKGSDDNPGTSDKPLATITEALRRIKVKKSLVKVKIPWGMWDLYGGWTPNRNIKMSEAEQFKQNLENGYFDRMINLYIPIIESG